MSHPDPVSYTHLDVYKRQILTHSFISGIVAQVIVHKMIVPGVRNKLLALLSCTPEKFTDWIGYLVSLHDVGKIEGQFQYRWLPMKESMDKEGVKPDFPALNQIRHEKTTWRCLRERLWKEASNQSAAKFYADILEAVSYTHLDVYKRQVLGTE